MIGFIRIAILLVASIISFYSSRYVTSEKYERQAIEYGVGFYDAKTKEFSFLTPEDAMGRAKAEEVARKATDEIKAAYKKMEGR